MVMLRGRTLDGVHPETDIDPAKPPIDPQQKKTPRHHPAGSYPSLYKSTTKTGEANRRRSREGKLSEVRAKPPSVSATFSPNLYHPAACIRLRRLRNPTKQTLQQKLRRELS